MASPSVGCRYGVRRTSAAPPGWRLPAGCAAAGLPARRRGGARCGRSVAAGPAGPAAVDGSATRHRSASARPNQATPRCLAPGWWAAGRMAEDGDVVVLDEADRDALGAGLFGDVELPEGVPWHESALAEGGVDGPAAVDEGEPGVQAGVDD